MILLKNRQGAASNFANMSAAKLHRFRDVGRKILGVGLNYRSVGVEIGAQVLKEPVVFLKPTSSYITQGQKIKLPPNSNEMHHEVELGVIIGTPGSNIPKSKALEHIGGYCLALDMTDKNKLTELREKGLCWTLAKGFDTSCPVSDFIEKDKIPDPQNVPLWLTVNGDKKQDANTGDMIFDVPTLISWMSDYFRLETGDLILTGTPDGIGPVKSGDVLECGLTNIAKMKFEVE